MSGPAFSGIPQAPAARTATLSNDVTVADVDDAAGAVDDRFSTALDAATPAIEDSPDGPRPDESRADDQQAQTSSSPCPTAASAVSTDGWPPPGLSSLFPDAPLFAASPVATVVAPTAMTSSLPVARSTLATPPAAPGASSPPAPRPVLDAGPAALPPDALGPLAPLASAPASAMAVPPTAAAAAGTASGATANPLPPVLAGTTLAAPLPTAGPAAAVVPFDPIAAALARQPGVLLLPNGEDRVAVLDALGRPVDSAAITTLDALAPLALPTAVTPKLDLAQAFPTPVPLPSPRFADELGARVQWIAEQQGGEATLRIAPDGLGPVEIRLKLDGERVDLGFSASQPETRQALEQALPKLREMLAQQGLQLGNADVGHRHAGHAQDGDSRRSDSRGDSLDDDIVRDARLAGAGMQAGGTLIGRGGLGVLDLYA